jgi:mono/diheme cytochrome c family protein
MRRRDFISAIALFAMVPLAGYAQQVVPSAAQQSGAALYSQHCSKCHDDANARVPNLTVLRSMTREQVERTLSTGSMAPIAQELTNAERTGIASFIAAKAS